jgi:hypothetical protein
MRASLLTENWNNKRKGEPASWERRETIWIFVIQQGESCECCLDTLKRFSIACFTFLPSWLDEYVAMVRVWL